jgi:Peptidase M15
MSRDPNSPEFTNKKSAHIFGYAFDLVSDGMKNNSANRAWIAQEAAKLGLWIKDEYVEESPDKTAPHMHFQEANWAGNPGGFTPIPIQGSKSDFVLKEPKIQDQPQKQKLVLHFSTREFMCIECLKLGRENAGNGINSELINLLDQLRTELGDNPIIVKLGYVCEEHQLTVQTPYSTNGVEPNHLEGRAADIVVTNTKSDIVAIAAEKIGFYKVIVYNDDVVHVEVQPAELVLDSKASALEELVAPLREKLAEFKKYIQQLIAEIPSAKELLDNIYNQVEEQVEKRIDEIKKLAKENWPGAEKFAKEKLTEVENLIKAMTDYINGLLPPSIKEKLGKFSEKVSNFEETATEKISELLWGTEGQESPKEIDAAPEFNVASADSNVLTTRDSTTLDFSSSDQLGIPYSPGNPLEDLLMDPKWLQFKPSSLLTNVVGNDPMDLTKFYINIKGINYSGSHS